MRLAGLSSRVRQRPLGRPHRGSPRRKLIDLAALTQIPVARASTERFRALLGDDYSEVEEAIAAAGPLLAGRVIWHVNSTARGGGVAEMLQSLLAYARGAGVDVRWLTIGGNEEFFRVTKRIHNHLHGSPGDGG